MTNPIDDYLAGLGEADREALQRLRSTILGVIPAAEQGLSYGMPSFTAAYKNHLSYFPHSGSVLAGIDPQLLEGFDHSAKGTLRFSVDTPLPAELVEALIRAKAREAGVDLESPTK